MLKDQALLKLYRIYVILELWSVNGYLFPHVSYFTKAMLAIPSTLVASERVFSTADNIISRREASLLTDMLINIKHNRTFYYIFK